MAVLISKPDNQWHQIFGNAIGVFGTIGVKNTANTGNVCGLFRHITSILASNKYGYIAASLTSRGNCVKRGWVQFSIIMFSNN
jgi:hypothetical protein